LKDKENESPVPKYKRDLVQKMKILRQELQNLQPQGGHCRMEVSRDELIFNFPKISCIIKPFFWYIFNIAQDNMYRLRKIWKM
jgi:hypothetical protein